MRPGEDLVEEPFQRLIDAGPAARAAVRRLLGADGHAQGQAVPREPARERRTLRGRSGTASRPQPRRRPRGGLRLMLAVARPGVRGGTRRVLPRGPPRRHRDRMRRDDPAARSSRVAVCESAGSCSAASGERAAEAEASAAAFLDGALETRIVVSDFRDGFFPYDGRRDQGLLRDAQTRLLPRPHLHALAKDLHQDHRVCLRADLEHVPRSPDPRVRDPEVRRRHGHAERLRRRSTTDVCRRKVDAPARPLPLPAREAVVQRGHVLGPAAPSRDRVPNRRRLCRGVPLPQGGRLHEPRRSPTRPWRHR